MRRFQSRVLRSVGLSLALTGLAVVAPTASAAADDCPNAAIRAKQGPAAQALPDCMAFEMVTPQNKLGEIPRYPMISEDGTRVHYVIRAALADTPGYQDPVFGDAYVASRDATGWRTSPLALPTELGIAGDFPAADGFTSDLTRWLSRGSTESQRLLGWGRLFESSLSGPVLPRSPVLAPVDGQVYGLIAQGGTYVGASNDLSRVVYVPGGLSGNQAQVRYLPDDPAPMAGVDLEARNQYVLSRDALGTPTFDLLARDSAGKAWGGNCGAWLGGGQAPKINRGGRNTGAISSDGKTMLISARAAQPATGPCNTANGVRILERRETATGVEIRQLISPECTAACAADGDDLFEGASVDGSKLYFTTTRQLVNADTDSGPGCANRVADSTGCDLYLYDAAEPLGQRLTLVSAGSAPASVARNLVAIAADGSRAYFVAGAALTSVPNSEGDTAVAGQPNLYVFSASDGRTSFVATLQPEDGCVTDCDYFALYGQGASGDYNRVRIAPQMGEDEQGRQVGGDGHILLFTSYQPIVADDGNSLRDIYLYDDEAQKLERVSRPASGASDGGTADTGIERLPGTAPLPDRVVRNRMVSEDGRTVVFSSPRALTPDADAGAPNVFVWRLDGGAPSLAKLPGYFGAGETGVEGHVTVSPDGRSIAFQTRAALVEQDRDGDGMDIYLARAGGGIAATGGDGRCDVLAGACGGPPAARVGVDSRTASPLGAGNVAAGERAALRLRAPSRAARRRAARSGVVRITVRAARAGRLTVTARARLAGRRQRLGRVSERVDAAGDAVTVAVPLKQTARKRLRSGRSLRIVVEARQPGAGARSIGIRLPGGRS